MKTRMQMALLKNLLKLGLGIYLTTQLTACNPCPSPEASERAREVLEETSPRNTNEHPKVTCPNIGYTLPNGDCKGRATIYNQAGCE